MRKSIAKTTAMMMAALMAAGSLTACGGSAGGSDSGATTAAEGAGTAAGQEITFLNSKGEIQAALEDMAEAFTEETGIKVDVMACGAGEVPYTKITSMYNSGTAPTMAMLDTTDIIALAEEYALDLSDSAWIEYCEDQITKVNGKVYSFPFCVEGRGIIYNKAAIEEKLGREFDPDSINSLDALKAILEELRAAGMENPVVISKEDWSLGAHQLGFLYDAYDGTTEGSAKIIEDLKSGAVKAADYERFNQFVDTFDVLKEYNINKNDPLGALYEQDPIYLADKEAAFWLNGCWAWPNLYDAGADAEDGYGFIPWVLGNDTADFANNGIQAAASKQVMIDKKQATPEQQEAAKQFIDWIVNSEAGQKAVVEDCALISACSNNTFAPLDPLGQDIKAKMEEGRVYSSCFIAPGDHWSVLGAEMQKYLAGESSREQLAAAVDAYWTAQ